MVQNSGHQRLYGSSRYSTLSEPLPNRRASLLRSASTAISRAWRSLSAITCLPSRSRRSLAAIACLKTCSPRSASLSSSIKLSLSGLAVEPLLKIPGCRTTGDGLGMRALISAFWSFCSRRLSCRLCSLLISCSSCASRASSSARRCLLASS